MRPATGALVALLVLALAPVATAKSQPAGSGGGAQGGDQAGRPGLLALGTGFHRQGASDRVREVQRRLNRLGYGAGAVDGLFGPITDAAVRRFQADNDLAVDGIAGPRTQGRLTAVTRNAERLLARGSGFTRPGGSDRVREVQRRLNRLGYRAGAVDGLFGPITDAAVRRFQADRKLSIDGLAGPRTLTALGAAKPQLASTRPAEPRRPSRPVTRTTKRPHAPPLTGDRAARDKAPPLGAGPFKPAKKAGLRWDIVIPILAFVVLFAVVLVALGGDQSSRREAELAEPEPEPGAPEAGPGTAAAPRTVRRDWRTELVDVPHAGRIYGFGARAHRAGSPRVGSESGVLYVELSLFAEGQRRRWETDPLDAGAPFSVSVKDLEESVREIVVPRLATLARTMRNAGVNVQPADLEVLPFMLELSPELEGELVRRRLSVRV